MKEVLGTAGLGALLCLPCLLVAGGLSAAAFGGGLVAFATNPGAQGAGLALLLAANALVFWYLRRRRQACPTCGVRERGHGSYAAEQRTPLP